jgi:hypothetical protein
MVGFFSVGILPVGILLGRLFAFWSASLLGRFIPVGKFRSAFSLDSIFRAFLYWPIISGNNVKKKLKFTCVVLLYFALL